MKPDISKIKPNRVLKKSNLLRIIKSTKIAIISIFIITVATLSILFVNASIASGNEITIIERRIAETLNARAKLDSEAQKPVDVDKIVKANIFGELGIKINTPEPKAPPKSASLDIKLVGTFIDSSDPIAIIYDVKNKQQELFSVNDDIFSAAKLLKIGSDHVEIEREGEKELLYIDDGGGPTVASAGGSFASSGSGDLTTSRIKVDSAKLDAALENLPLLLTQARAVPYFKNGKSVGLRLFAIKSGSLFQDIGLKNGDILKDINGNSLADITQAVKLFETLREERQVNLTLERAKKPILYEYEID